MNNWIPHGSHVMYGLRFLVIRTSRGSVQTGHGNLFLPLNSIILYRLVISEAYAPNVIVTPLTAASSLPTWMVERRAIEINAYFAIFGVF